MNDIIDNNRSQTELALSIQNYSTPSAVLAAVLAAIMACGTASGENRPPNPGGPQAVRAAVKEGLITYRLTTPEELEPLLGKPDNQRDQGGDEEQFRVLEYPGVTAKFGRLGMFQKHYTLRELQVEAQGIDIGQSRQVVLRTPADLKRLDWFWGLATVSLARLDLGDQLGILQTLSFDSQTVWPATDKLPAGFDPGRLLEEGKNPGLGVHELQEEGIDGRGIGIAIIDQPLLLNHEEYNDRIATYTAVEVDGVPPQMHGAAMASIAVGKTCGVAPGAALYFVAVPTWKWTQNEPYAKQLERFIELNRSLTNSPKIKVVSISMGSFSERPDFARWQETVKRAEENGILVISCDPTFLRLGTLKRIEDHPEMKPTDYTRGLYFYPGANLCVPASNRTWADFRGPRCYTYGRLGGLSNTAPYLAGVAALAWQVNPDISPAEMVALWKRTAIVTPVGPVIDPVAVVEAAKTGKGTLAASR
jgi:hypothetical protein